MIWRKRTSQADSPKKSWRRRSTIAGVFLIAVLGIVYGCGFAAWPARWAAERQLRRGTVSAAFAWLAWAERLDREDYRTELMRANCFRRLGRQDAWQAAIGAARGKGAPPEALEQEMVLGALRWGQVDRISSSTLEDLVNADVSPPEAVTAVVYALLAQGEPQQARAALDAWTPDPEDQAQASFLRGVVAQWADDHRLAQTEFEDALRRQPGHEPARAALAQVLEDQTRFEQALPHYAALAAAFPEEETTRISLARVLRKVGRPDDARAVLAPLAASPGVAPAVAAELTQIEFESGNYAAAQQAFEQTGLDPEQPSDAMRAALSARALSGDAAGARRRLTRVIEGEHRSQWIEELQRRLALDPGDAPAAQELQHATAGAPVADPAPPDVSPLYAEHCAGCHGATGDGQGSAARFLYPPPRDLRGENYRLVSTLNGVPAAEDIQRVLQRGIPGTAMPSFAHLPEDQRRELAEQVLRLRREGVLQQLLAQASDEDEAFDDEELRRALAARTTPGPTLAAPKIGPADAQAIDRGKELYFQVGCHACHGPDGTGAPDVLLRDERGRPNLPRDLARDPMKGGEAPESLYRRLRLGMPGTAHPACSTLDEGELADLVQFCRSLGREPKRTLTNYQRGLRAARLGSRIPFGPPPREP